jgi:hypothetical protein
MKVLSELVDREEPAWPLVQRWIRSARCPVEVLPVQGVNGEIALAALQVTTRSPLGAIVYETGGILVDHGWLRLLGSGSPRLPRSLPQWNATMNGTEIGRPAPLLLIADDVVGGFFAIDGGGLGLEPGTVAYFPPDLLRWESLDMGHTRFVQWVLSGKLEGFYAGYRWKGWEKDLAAIPGDRAYSIFPPPVFKGDPYPQRSRKPVPVEEVYHFHQNLAYQLKDAPDGGQVQFNDLKGSP